MHKNAMMMLALVATLASGAVMAQQGGGKDQGSGTLNSPQQGGNTDGQTGKQQRLHKYLHQYKRNGSQ